MIQGLSNIIGKSSEESEESIAEIYFGNAVDQISAKSAGSETEVNGNVVSFTSNPKEMDF